VTAFASSAGWSPALWLLPSLGLATTTLALGSWLPVRGVGCALAVGWVAAAAITVRGAPSSEAIESFVAFRPSGQLVLVLVALVAATVVVLRRDAFDSLDLRRP
jgi:hypothetical protein